MSRKSVKLAITASLLALVSGGCAELNSISRVESIPGPKNGKVLTVDAKQRHLVMSRVGPDGAEQMRVCAEAAPDVFSALAASGSLSVDASGSGSGQGAFSLSETAATIERTQTINMLRESFYRTCERYLSGALSRSQLIIQAARDQRVMTSILAIEQLTGAVRPPSTIISGPGTQASAFSGAQAAELVKDYRERREAKEAARDTAKKALDDAKDDGGKCKDNVDCAALEATLSSAQSDLDKAQAGLDNAVAVAKNLTSAAAASTLGGTNTSSGTQAAQFDADKMAHIAQAVVAIHDRAIINEPLMFCIAILSGDDATKQSEATNEDGTKIATSDVTPKSPELTGASGAALFETCQRILIEATARDRELLSLSALSNSVGAAQALNHYLRRGQSQGEYNRRLGLARTAASRLNLGSTSSDVQFVLYGARPQDQARLLVELRKTEENTVGRRDLGVD